MEPDDWNDKCGPHSIRCRNLEVVHNELDEIEKVAARLPDGSNAGSNNPALEAELGTALRRIDELSSRILELLVEAAQLRGQPGTEFPQISKTRAGV